MKHHSILSVETFTLEGCAFRDDEISRFGEYRTKRLAIEAWDAPPQGAAHNTLIQNEKNHIR